MARFDLAIVGVFNREVTYHKDGTVKVVYTNRDSDRGGATKWGISSKAYPMLDIENISKMQARDIFKSDYWNFLNLSDVTNQLLAECIMDFAVTSGQKTSAKTIQKIIGVHVDGFIGPVTLKAINSVDAEVVILKFALARIRYYSLVVKRHAGQIANLRGWINRALRIAGAMKE